MTNHQNRGRVEILPINNKYRQKVDRDMRDAIAKIGHWVPEALANEGMLVRNKHSGLLAIMFWPHPSSPCTKNVDQDKAETALKAARAEVPE